MTKDNLKNSCPRQRSRSSPQDDDEATKAASEFRGCAFIVTTEKLEVGA